MRGTLLALWLCLMFGTPLQAQEAEARAILEKAIITQGDEKVALKLMSAVAKAKGTVHIMDMAFDMTLQSWQQLPGKLKTVIGMSGNGVDFGIVEVINGDKGWIALNGMVADLDADQIKDAKALMHVERVTSLVGIKADKEMKLAPLGETKAGDKALVGLKVTKKGQRDVSLYFDKMTNFLVKAEYRALEPITKQEVTEEKLFGGYKELVPNLKIASKIAVKHDGKLFMELEITEIRPVDRHEDGTFAQPK